MKNSYIAILFVCSILMSSCVTPGSVGQKETADVSLYYFEETEQLKPSHIRELMGNYLASEYTNDSVFVSEENIAYFVSSQNVNNTFQLALETGNFAFNKMVGYMGDFKPDLPSPDKSEELAIQFLRQNEIYPYQVDQLVLVHQGGLKSASISANNQRINVIDKTITLYYGRMIDGLNVIGPGSKIVVQVGDEGEIVGLINWWRKIARKDTLSSSQLITEKEAHRQAIKVISQEYGEVEYEIFNMFKAYYDNNGPTLQPVYGFEVKIKPGKELKPINYLCVIPMLKNPTEKLNLRELDPQALEKIQKTYEDANTGESQGKID